MPLVSVITPAFNSARFLPDAIRSVQNQAMGDWEMIIVDDASTDETSEIISPFLSDDRIKFHRLSRNSGAGIARQTALDMASGRYIAFLDSDDMWKPEKLEAQIAFMNENAQPFTFSSYDCMDEDGKPLGKRIQAPSPLTYKMLFYCNFVGNLTGIYDTERFGKIAISSIRKRQDWIVWLTILKQLRSVKAVEESLAVYRVRQDSISASKWKLLRHNFVVYRQFHRQTVVGALISMMGFLYTQLLVKPRFVRQIG